VQVNGNDLVAALDLDLGDAGSIQEYRVFFRYLRIF